MPNFSKTPPLKGVIVPIREPRWAWLFVAGLFFALWIASQIPLLAPRGLFPSPGEMTIWVAVGALAALNRPFGSKKMLGIGLMVLVPAIARLGAVPATLVMAGVYLLAEGALGAAEKFLIGHQEKQPKPLEIGELSAVASSALVAGSVFSLGALEGWSMPAQLTASVGAYGTVSLGLLLLRARFFSVSVESWRHRSLVFGFDLIGLAFGALIEAVANRSSWTLTGPIVLVIAVLAAEAGRSQIHRGIAEQKLMDLERLQQAHVRILAETSGMAGIAQQILIECRNVLPLGWFQFELLAEMTGEDIAGDSETEEGQGRSWSAGPNGALFEGEPRPSSRPEMLPGIHRRADWKIIEAPLEAEDELLARVRLWCDPRRFESGAEKLFSTLVPQMASSVHRAYLDREAKLDPLTGVPVRRILESSMQKAYQQCFEEGQSMAVIMCDIDFFKKVNDVYGHAAGDEALKLVAQTLASQRREGDLCCRYGGEEFTLLLEKTGGRAALQLAERLRVAIEGLDLVYEDRAISLTLSLGVAAFPEVHIKTASELLLLADEALYRCKEQGRNRCLLYLGNGRFQSVSGGSAESLDDPDVSLPRIFS